MSLARASLVCASCRAFVAAVLAPVGDGAVALCWYCGHKVESHGADPETAWAATCECEADVVFPEDELERRAAARAGGWGARVRARLSIPEPRVAERARRVERVERWGRGAAGVCTWPGCERRARTGSRCGHHDGSHRQR